MNRADVDIDTPTAFRPGTIFQWVRASILKDGELRQHPCGYYPQNIALDHLTGLSAVPYDVADELGYYKLDFLHLSVYDNFESREEIDALLEIEPDWGILNIPQEQKKLFQLSKHGEVLDVIKPRSVEELADVLALIRPGKKQLVNLYKAQRESTRRILYAKDEGGYSFKKSHAIAYALVIVLQLHLIEAGIL
jgi:DNA polymerase III alpha subunit